MTTKKSTITFDLHSGPTTPDFDGGSRGYSARVILDPERRRVFLTADIGPAMPAPLYHERWVSLHVNPAAAEEIVAERLQGQTETIQEIFALYEGAEWDGHNLKGQWSAPDERNALLEQLERSLDDVPCYWAARDWLYNDARTLAQEALRAFKKGPEAMEEYIRELVAQAKTDDCLLDPSDVARTLDKFMGDLKREVLDEIGEEN